MLYRATLLSTLLFFATSASAFMAPTDIESGEPQEMDGIDLLQPPTLAGAASDSLADSSAWWMYRAIEILAEVLGPNVPTDPKAGTGGTSPDNGTSPDGGTSSPDGGEAPKDGGDTGGEDTGSTESTAATTDVVVTWDLPELMTDWMVAELRSQTAGSIIDSDTGYRLRLDDRAYDAASPYLRADFTAQLGYDDGSCTVAVSLPITAVVTSGSLELVAWTTYGTAVESCD